MSLSKIKSVFLEIIDADRSQWESLLREKCSDDAELMSAVRKLLLTHEKASFLDDAEDTQERLHQNVLQAAKLLEFDTHGLNAEQREPHQDLSGTDIGKYRLMEWLAEGGFGQVYVGQQSHPVRRLVAVKLLKRGMESREVVARFEAERQALALMNHPNIAQVFDAGTTEAGQLYLVMELVRGQPITTFCRDQHFSIRDKLQLMTDVCYAVQHAHQKGIIHRDLKPSNVLVAMDDTKPLAKIIDFGIAKALDQRLTDKTIYTRFAQIIGTPMYMSPEQAEMKAQEVDTLTDVYALGVLLYELLTERTPFDKQKMQSATFDEMRRMIREDQPLRPSARVTEVIAPDSTKSNPQQPGTEALRKQAVGIANQLKGDLDWIVLKAMEKDRRRRYETPAELARDIQRYLASEPVLARAPSKFYRLSRFAQRNKLAVIATSLVLLSMIGGTGISVWQAMRATRAQAEAEQLRQEALQSVERLKEANILIDSARANIDQQRYEEAFHQLTEATRLQPDHYLTWAGRGNLYVRLGAWPAAANDYAKAIGLGAPANSPSWWGVPELMIYNGDLKSYETICKALRTQIQRSDDPVIVLHAVRGLCLKPIDPPLAEELAAGLDKLDLSMDVGRFPGPPGLPGGPPFQAGRGGPPFFREAGPRPVGLQRDISDYIKALVAYRAGKFQQVIELLEREPPPQRRDRDSDARGLLSAPLLAMAYHEKNEPEMAEKFLNQGIEKLDTWVEAMASGSATGFPWFDGLDAWILVNEAHGRIHGEPLPADPRLQQWHERLNFF